MKFRKRKNNEFNLLLVEGENNIEKPEKIHVRIPQMEEVEPRLISIYETANTLKIDQRKD